MRMLLCIVLLLLALALLSGVPQTSSSAGSQAMISTSTNGTDAPSSNDYVALARQDAIEVGIDPNVFVRQINQESRFNPQAVGLDGEIGIAQFLPSTAASLGIDPHDPAASLKAAARLMASSVRAYGGDYAKALAVYSCGEGCVDQAIQQCGSWWLSCVPEVTQAYIHIILGTTFAHDLREFDG
jgi:soluble lytic murein transglycosylase-like protein